MPFCLNIIFIAIYVNQSSTEHVYSWHAAAATSIEKTLKSQTIANFYFRTEVDVLVLDFTRNAV